MRWLRHLFAPAAQAAFPPASLDRIAQAIADGEKRHSGQVMFAVESDLSLTLLWQGINARQRAEHAFAVLRTWDTQANNGVLIYLLLADHAIEIVADRGLRAQVDEAQWQLVCEHLRQQLNERGHEAAVLAAVNEVSDLLAARFAPDPAGRSRNELPDRPQLLG
ncbi:MULTISPECIES: TPM domain-containing protein [unclassified Stenotrophomonas]|uniref:TPM domain-containing protein n=1 Tax=unclassified Stenotrophomonas TaxID=196198 RepID=UPI0025E5143A|nr:MULTISPECIES: TPM domain-containing protein [unclassified Stenotrophomonas]